MLPIHVLAVILGAIASAIPQLEGALPAAWKAWLDGLATVCTLAVTVLVPLTPQAKGVGKVVATVGSLLRAASLTLVALAVTVSCGELLSACSTVQAVAPYFEKVAAIIVADLTAGKTYAQIETDVATSLGGQAGVDVVVVLNDVVAFLIDDGVLPANLLPQAKAVQGAARAKLAARGAQ